MPPISPTSCAPRCARCRRAVEAGQALALSRPDILRLVVAPNAARVALPPTQCLALIKNSTLAIAIGYQDLMAVINTAITQTGLALEGISLALAAIWPGLALGGALSAWNARSARHGPGDLHGARLGERPALLAALAGKAADAGRGDWPGRPCCWRRCSPPVRSPTGPCSTPSGAATRRPARKPPAPAGPPWARTCPVAVRRDAAGASRPALVACAALLLAVAVALGAGRLSGRARAGVAIAALALAAGALSGWPWGGEAIGPLRWGGLLVTLILAIAALLAAVPLAAGLALLRRSSSPAGSFAAATLIEAVRGVPLVTQLLFASFVLPMLLGGGVSKFSMALAALTLHTACLLAEVLRGALQAIPPGQMAAAARWAWAPPWPTRP